MARILAAGIESPHSIQIPKSSLSRLARAYFSLPSFCLAVARVVSLTLLLFNASILDNLPIALSGEIGLVSFSRAAISFSVVVIVVFIFSANCFFSLSFIVFSLFGLVP